MEIRVSDMMLCSNTPEVRAVATIVLDGDFAVHGLKVIMNANQLFVTMPDAPSANGRFYDVAHPINAQTRQFMANAVLAEYHRKTKQQEEEQMSSAGGGMSFSIKKEIVDKLFRKKKTIVFDNEGEYLKIHSLKKKGKYGMLNKKGVIKYYGKKRYLFLRKWKKAKKMSP